MKSLKIILIISILCNIILSYFIYDSVSSRKQSVNGEDSNQYRNIKNLTDPKIFKDIFLDRNDSVYREAFNKSFEDLPVQAYMLACTYYLLKQDSIRKKDILMISSEIKAIYGKAPQIAY